MMLKGQESRKERKYLAIAIENVVIRFVEVDQISYMFYSSVYRLITRYGGYQYLYVENGIKQIYQQKNEWPRAQNLIKKIILISIFLHSLPFLYTPLYPDNIQFSNIQKMQLNQMEHKTQEKSHAQSFHADDKNATASIFLNSYPTSFQGNQVSTSERNIKYILQSLPFQIFITIISLYSLFSDDIRTAATDASADLAFDIVHIILMVLFLIEVSLNWIISTEYRWSFYFFLDLVSSLTLLLDINMLTDLNSNSSYDLSKLASQSRASRVATRAVRIVKLIRIIRIIKLYQAASNAKQLKDNIKKRKLEEKKRHLAKVQSSSQNKSNNEKVGLQIKFNENNEKENTTGNIVHNEAKQHNKSQESLKNKKQSQTIVEADNFQEAKSNQSKISKVLSDLTIKKIVIVVLLLMIIVPLFDNTLYIQKGQSWDYFTSSIHAALLKNNELPSTSVIDYINSMIKSHQDDDYLIYFSTPFNQLPIYQHERFGKERIQQITSSIETINVTQVLSLRADLTVRPNLPETEDNQIYAVMSYRNYNQKASFFSMANTVFICIVLVSMLHFFTQDINEIIVAPIEKMMKQVIQMAKNPQSVSAIGLLENNQYETTIVHNAIVKIGALLSLVFGSAGAEIVGSNIMSEGDMNPMIGGKKKCAIFGFCDIKHFSDVTQLLQEDIMLFVNKIGQLIHSSVYRYGGSANKNIGEAFLMIWPLAENSYKLNEKTNQITWKRQKYVSIMCDFAVLSFIKAIVKIHKDPRILQYRKNKKLLKGLPNYQVKMGFGLHLGWAIEGAIGSEYKIDASYLSPNVNMASRLEAATKQFGVNILISEEMYETITPSLQKFCRNIDRVTVKGSAKPIRLYTIDLKLDNISPPMDKNIKYKNIQDMLDVETKRQINMEFLQDHKIDEYNAEQFIRQKKELRQVMIDAVSVEFKKRFDLGVQSYIDGQWTNAKLHLNEALKYSKHDGPTNNILNYMKKYDYVCPQTWKNYRPLTQK